jgi:hypothetical protein
MLSVVMRRVVGVLTGVLFTGPLFAAPLTLRPNQLLRIDFQIQGPFSQTPDVLYLGFGPATPVAYAIGSRNSWLYHDSQLIGHTVDSLFGDLVGPMGLHPAATWKSATSLYDFGSYATVDFGSFFDGNEVGHIDFSIESGELMFDSDQIQVVQTIATDFASGIVVAPLPNITSVRIIPEPSNIASAGTAILFALAAAWRRARK